MSSPFTQTQLKTPKGFEHLLEGLCKEVLRKQPENILEYATEHFSRLMKLREETGYDGYTPKSVIELESQEANERGAVQEIPVLLVPEEPKGEEPKGEEPTGEEHKGEEPTGDEPKEEEPKGEEPMGEEPKGEEPKGEEPKGEEPMGEELMGEEPKGEEPMGEEPKGEEPMGEEPMGEEQGTVGEIQDDAPEAEQTVTMPEETKTAEEITEEMRTEGERPEFEKTDLTSSLPEAEAPGDDASPDNEVTGSAEEGGDIISSNVAQDTEATVEAQGTAESEPMKDQAPEDSGEVPVDPASAELPASDGDSDS